MSYPLDVPEEQLRLRRSQKWTRYAPDVLPLPVAEIDVHLPPAVRARIQSAVDASDTGYAGDPAEAIAAFAEFAESSWGWTVDPSRVALAGDVAAIVTELLRRFIPSDSRVIICPPVYPPFYEWLEDGQVRTHEVPLRSRHEGYRLDVPGIVEAFRSGARALVLCNPHNPTGVIAKAEELAAIASAASRYGAIVISDEIQAPLCMSDTFVPYLSVSPEASATGFVVTSASKGWNIAGLKCAQVVVGSSAHAEAVEPLRHRLLGSTGILGLAATAAAYGESAGWLSQLLGSLRSNRDTLGELLATHMPSVRWLPPEAGFLAWLDMTALDVGPDPAAVALAEARVALRPGPDFGPPGIGHARLNFGCSEDLLSRAVKGLAALEARRAS